MLPCEQENRNQTLRYFRQEYEVGAALIAIGLQMLEGVWRSTNRGLRHSTKGILIGLCTKAIKQFRAILLSCEYGLAENADLSCRSFFESHVALRYILWEPKPLNECSIPLRGRLQTLFSKKSAIQHAPDFRAELYAAAPIIQQEKLYDSLAVKYADVMALLDEPGIRQRAADARKQIGSDWVEVLQKSKGYSGLRINELAEAYELHEYYDKIYGPQSARAHGGDAISFVRFDGRTLTSLFVSTPSALAVSIYLGTSEFGTFLHDVNQYFSLGYDEKLRELAGAVESCRQRNDGGLSVPGQLS